MNPRIEKMAKEIEKTKQKIAELQEKQRDMERQKTELENSEYVAIIRSLDLSPAELAAFLKAQASGRPAPGAVDQKQEDDYEK